VATFYAGTKGNDWTARIGACMAEDEATARHYAGRSGRVFVVEMDWDADFSFERVEVSREDIDANNWPGDTAASREALAVDVVEYEDMDERGDTHITIRLLTDAACAAVLSVSEVA
jgi:hypothetical protein